MIPAVKAKLLEGKRGLVVGIANEHSIAWGCAKAFRAFGAEVAVTYLNDKAKQFVEPLAHALEAPIVMPLDARVAGQMEAVFERVAEQWGILDFVVHSIAFSPKEALQGRVADVSRDGFLTTMEISCWTFIRMAHLAEPLMRNGGTLSTMTYYGSQMVVENYNIMGVAKAALESAVRYLAAELGPKGIRVHAVSPGPLATRAASGIPEFDALLEKAKAKAPSRTLVTIDDVGAATAFLAHDAARLITGETLYRRRISHHRLARLRRHRPDGLKDSAIQAVPTIFAIASPGSAAYRRCGKLVRPCCVRLLRRRAWS
jgi:enoyl-[acyl-carrier protein] reductase I